MEFERKKMTVIVPHPDDEVLGAGGTISLYSSLGWEISALVVSGHLPPLYTKKEFEITQNEYKQAAKIIGVKKTKFLELPATKIHETPISNLNESLSKFVIENDPSILLIPFPDRHVDHKLIFEASMVISRPVKFGTRIKLVAAYETLSETHWNAPYLEPNFIPNINIDISSTIKKKIDALRCYKSQISESKSPRSIDAVKSLAQFRGSQCGHDFAESFVCIRLDL